MEGTKLTVIDLDAEFFREHEKRCAEEARLKAMLEAQDNVIREKLSDYLKGLKKRLVEGETTGDPLQDELILRFGLFSKAELKKVVEFSKVLENSKGAELVIYARHEQTIRHVMIPTPGDENESATVWGFVFGILSGERLRIGETGNLIIPFARYFNNIPWQREPEERILEPFELGEAGLLSGPTPFDFIQAIWATEDPTPYPSSGFRYNHRNPEVVILLGEPTLLSDNCIIIGERRLGFVKTELEMLRSKLNIATPEEVVQGEGI